MDKNILNVLLFGSIAQGFKMIDVGVHAAIRNQTHEMNFFIVLFCIFKCTENNRMAMKRTVADGKINFYQILVNYSAGADVEMADFGIAHLTIRQANIFAGS